MDSQAVFANETKGSIYDLHNDFSSFNDDFKIDFGNKFGTAIVIPFPRDEILKHFKEKVLSTLIENFAPLIMRNQLKVDVCGEKLSIENYKEITSNLCSSSEAINFFEKAEFANNAIEYLDFLETSITQLHENANFEIDLDDNKLRDTSFLDIKEELNDLIQSNNIATFKINFSIPLINGESIKTFVEAAIQKANGLNGIERYHRSGMVMQDQKTRLGQRFNATLLCRDQELSRVLNIVEGTGHNKWVLKPGEGKKKFEGKKINFRIRI
jgi:hypothetical protein